MASVVSQTPARFTSGVSTDQPWQPLSMFGNENPFAYGTLEDDFYAFAASNYWTATKSGNGTIAAAAGDGGLILFTTNSSTPLAADICSIQAPAASFTVNGGLKKIFFLTRVQLSSATNNGLLCGLIQTTATPFTVTDGVYFLKATGAANNLILRSTNASVNTDLTIPTNSYTFADNTNIDLGFYIDRAGNVNAFIGSQLVGFIPQSGSGSTLPNRSYVGSFAPSLTTANLNLTLALQSGTASSKTMTADFLMASKER